MRYIDICCGMGSFTYSLRRLGFECVMACDTCPTARENFERNFGIAPQGDIKEIEAQTIPNHDVLCAGLPCQSFSRAGRHLGFLDSRGTLFFHVRRTHRTSSRSTSSSAASRCDTAGTTPLQARVYAIRSHCPNYSRIPSLLTPPLQTQPLQHRRRRSCALPHMP